MMREIIPNILWIGNAFDARDVKGVLAAGVSVVIDLAMEEPPILFPREIVYCRFPLLDGEGNSAALLRSVIDTTVNFVSTKQPTLVACSGGMSRSPAIVSAMIAKVQSIGLAEAVERVTATGPCDFSGCDLRIAHPVQNRNWSMQKEAFCLRMLVIHQNNS